MSTNYIDQITDTGGTVQDIAESVSTRIFRATCSTAAATAAKVATLDADTNKNFTLATGVRVAVTFTYGNSATTPTLRVDGSSTGTAKTIVTPTAVATLTAGNGTTYNTWGPYETVIFTYNGTYWVKGGTGYSIYNAYALAPKVTEAYSTANNSYPLLMTATAGISSTSSRGNTTAILNNQIYANPSTGTITATRFNGGASASDGTAEKVANVKYGSSAPSGTATEGTVYFQTGSSAYTFQPRVNLSSLSASTTQSTWTSFTLPTGLYLITFQVNCGSASTYILRVDLLAGSNTITQVRTASANSGNLILNGAGLVECTSSTTMYFNAITSSGSISNCELHYSYVKLF